MTTTTTKSYMEILPKPELFNDCTTPLNEKNKISNKKIYRWTWPHGKTLNELLPRHENDLDYETVDRLLYPKGR